MFINIKPALNDQWWVLITDVYGAINKWVKLCKTLAEARQLKKRLLGI
jgi:hypothetical protein